MLNNSKSKKYCNFVDTEFKKLMKIVKNEEVNIPIFWQISTKFSKNFDDIKKDLKKQKVKTSDNIFFWDTFLGLKCGLFLNETSILKCFCRISNFSFYLNKNELWKNCEGNY